MSHLKCGEVLPHLESFRRGDCSPELRLLVEEHTGRCPECRRRLAHLSQLTAMLSAWRPRRAPRWLKIEVAEAVSADMEQAARRLHGGGLLLRAPRRGVWRLSGWQRVANFVVLAALLFLALAILWRLATLHFPRL